MLDDAASVAIPSSQATSDHNTTPENVFGGKTTDRANGKGVDQHGKTTQEKAQDGPLADCFTTTAVNITNGAK